MIETTQSKAAPTAMQLALQAAQAAEKPLRPAVPDKAGQRLDTDYDPDPALEQTPLKNNTLKLKPRKR